MMAGKLEQRLHRVLEERAENDLERFLKETDPHKSVLNLANNDYLRLAGHPAVRAAACEAIETFGTSSSASPLVSGFGPAQKELLERLKVWHGFPSGMVWNSGYAANQAILSKLPRRGDLVLADRLIHHSMIAGIMQSGARLIRYSHCDLEKLRALLAMHATKDRQVFVVTESVFSMDGDYPKLAEIAGLRREFEFCWVLDEAHGIGWYGETGCGLAEMFGCSEEVDVLIGTLGKALGSMGAYALFNDSVYERFLINFAGEFIYSTYLAPSMAAAARAAVDIACHMAGERLAGHGLSRRFRGRLAELGYNVLQGDSPIVSVPLGSAGEVLAVAEVLEEAGAMVGAIRPPTVPEGSSRLRISLNARLRDEDLESVVECLRR